MRREGPIAVTMISGVLYLLSSIFSFPFLESIGAGLNSWFTIVKAMMCLLGVISLLKVHGLVISQKRPDTPYSIIVLVSMLGYMILGLIEGQSGEIFSTLYNNVFSVIVMSIFSSLTFWIGSAAYRAFRARSVEASILLISAALLMLGGTTIGPKISTKLPEISTWILNVPNTAGMRAVGMAGAIGGIVVALRVLLGIERNYLGLD